MHVCTRKCMYYVVDLLHYMFSSMMCVLVHMYGMCVSVLDVYVCVRVRVLDVYVYVYSMCTCDVRGMYV